MRYKKKMNGMERLTSQVSDKAKRYEIPVLKDETLASRIAYVNMFASYEEEEINHLSTLVSKRKNRWSANTTNESFSSLTIKTCLPSPAPRCI